MASFQNFSVTPTGNGKFKVQAVVIGSNGTQVDLTGINAVIVPDDLDELMTTEELEALYRDNIAQQALLKKSGIS